MVGNATGGPASAAGTPLVRVGRGRYVLADASSGAGATGLLDPLGVTEAGPADSGGIFISYRREDAAYPAGWLSGELAQRFGADRVFKDVDSIEPGDDFAEMIAAAVGSCAALVAVIGPRWLAATDEHGQRRLDDPADLVRLEIEAALARSVRVIPVLVDGARMPRRGQLPASLGSLATRQAVELTPARFRNELGPLLSVLDKALAHPPAPPPPGSPSPSPPARHSGRAPAMAAPVAVRPRPAPHQESAPGEWNGTDYYVRFGFGDYERRCWDDARRWCFVSAGGGGRWTRPLRQLQPGARAFVHHVSDGYVGVGRVLAAAVPISDFIVTRDGQSVPLLQVPLRNEAIKDSADDPQRTEQIVRMHWEWSVPDSQAIWQRHFFSRLKTVTELRDLQTVKAICEHAGIPISKAEAAQA